MKLFGIEFAPFRLPKERRLQTFSAVFHIVIVLIGPAITSLGLFAVFFTRFWWIVAGYGAWLYYDNYYVQIQKFGGRRSEFIRRGVPTEYLRDYFPISLHKTADLDPKKNYIMGYHPHGIIPIGSVCHFGTEATGFSEKYPGITPYLLSHSMNFGWPIVREYALLQGICDVSRESIQWLMTRMGQGKAAVIVVGGVAEMMLSTPNKHRVVLKTRKGFVKLAIQNGAYLVPVYSFGETDIYQQVISKPGSIFRRFQNLVKSLLRFAPFIFYGRGIFQYSFGLTPYRKPINTVVGAAIPVVQNSKPSQEEIDTLHETYVTALRELFEQNKQCFDVPEDVHLEIY